MDLYFNSLPELNLSEFDHLTIPTGEQLDDFLARGWYRMQENLFTVHYIAGKKENEINAAIWLRVPLEKFKKSKSQRQISNRIEKKFKIVVRKAIFDKKKARLYEQYVKKIRWRGDSFWTLEQPKFNSWEVCIYDGPELIAFSFFDLGKKAISSIVGIYHPDYEKYSLGNYTMIAEIEYGRQNGFEYYYPGYFVIGNPDFDYKLRFLPIEFYRFFTQTWHPIYDFSEIDNILKYFEIKLNELSNFLTFQNIGNQVIKISMDAQVFLFEFREYGYLLDHPYCLILKPYQPADAFDVVVYDVKKSKYALCKARHPISLLDYFDFFNGENSEDFLILEDKDPEGFNYALDKKGLEVEEIIAYCDTSEDVFYAIKKYNFQK